MQNEQGEEIDLHELYQDTTHIPSSVFNPKASKASATNIEACRATSPVVLTSRALRHHQGTSASHPWISLPYLYVEHQSFLLSST